MSLDLPPLVWFGAFLLLYVFFREAEQLCFCSIFAHFLKAGDSRHCSIILVFTVLGYGC